MKIIRRYDTGGDIRYLPIDVEEAKTASSSSNGGFDGSSGATSKLSEISKTVIEQAKSANGINADVTWFLNWLDGKLLSGMDPNGENLTARDVFQAQVYLNRINQSTKKRDDAISQLNKEDAWGDIAITETGDIYAQNKETNKLEIISLDDFKKNRDLYVPLTNQSLLHYRENTPFLSDRILHDIQNAVGTNSITKAVFELIAKFGTQESDTFGKKMGNKITKGFERLIGDGPDGVYKVTSKTKFGSKDTEELTAAVNYLYRALPSTYQGALEAKAAKEGMNAFNLLAMMVQSNALYEESAQFDSSATKELGGTSGSSGSGGSNQKVTMTLAETYATGEGAGIPRNYEITPEGSKSRMFAVGVNVGSVMESDGKTPIGTANVLHILKSGSGIRQVSLNTVVFGDQLVSSDSDKSAIVYNNSDMRRFELPAKEVNGQIVPDWDVYNKLEKVNELLKENEGSLTEAYIQNIIKTHAPGAIYNRETGIVSWRNTHAFLTFGAVVSSDAVEGMDLENSKFVQKVSDDDATKSFRDRYEEAVVYGVADHKKGDLEITGHGEYKRFLKRHTSPRSFYKANVWIPLNDATVATAIYNGQRVPADAYTDISERAALREERQQIRTNFM